MSDPNTEAREVLDAEVYERGLRSGDPIGVLREQRARLAAALEHAERALERKDEALQAIAALEDEFDSEGYASVDQRFAWAMRRAREALTAAHG